MTKELGKGAASIFSGISQPSEDESHILKDEIHHSSVETQKQKDENQQDDSQNTIDLKVLEQAIEEGMRYPKVTVYNPIVAGFMRYKEIKTPRFKLSPEIETRLEKVLKREDPELWKAIESKIQWKKRKRE
ncbi:Uncharacterised protein [uncultured archaeon]|nr:Uncharacterised protein [uncultured archaeon]